MGVAIVVTIPATILWRGAEFLLGTSNYCAPDMLEQDYIGLPGYEGEGGHPTQLMGLGLFGCGMIIIMRDKL